MSSPIVQFVDTPVEEAASVTLGQALEAVLAPVDGEQRLVRVGNGRSLLRKPRSARGPSIYIRVSLPTAGTSDSTPAAQH